MAKKNLLQNRLFLGIVSILALLIFVIIMVVVNSRPKYNDEYFVSDDSKIVLAMHAEASEDGKTPTTTYMVYYYSEDKITGIKQFYKFDEEAKAKEVFDELDVSNMEWIAEKSLDGHFIIFNLAPSQYEELTTQDVRNAVEQPEEPESETESGETNE